MSAAPPLADPLPTKPPALDGIVSALLWLCGGLLAVCSVAAVVMTRHWPMVGDAALMHYAVFLMERGWVPYRDFQDMNMPGAYLFTRGAMRLLGQGAAGWRCFDLGLMAVAAMSYWIIARPYSRLAALWAAALLLLIHAQDGIQQAGQRDLVMAVLELAGVASLFLCVRRRRWWLAMPFGLCMGLAVTVKPTAAPLGVLLLGLGMWQWQRTKDSSPIHEVSGGGMWAIASAGLASMVLPIAAVLAWLDLHGALGSFRVVVDSVVPFHASLARRPIGFLFIHSVAPLTTIIAVWVVCLFGKRRSRLNFERAALWTCALAGLASYVLQGKGLPYHRYPLLAFLLVLMGIELAALLRERHWMRWVAAVTLCAGAVMIGPVSVVKMSHYDWRNHELTSMVDADLDRLGGSQLNRRVQCLDSVRGCLGALYEARLEQATPLFYDEFLFSPEQPSDGWDVVGRTRAEFLQRIEERPPRVFVVFSGLFLESSSSFDKLQSWPAFASFLSTHYRLDVERAPPHPIRWWARSEPAPRYRIYVLH